MKTAWSPEHSSQRRIRRRGKRMINGGQPQTQGRWGSGGGGDTKRQRVIRSRDANGW